MLTQDQWLDRLKFYDAKLERLERDIGAFNIESAHKTFHEVQKAYYKCFAEYRHLVKKHRRLSNRLLAIGSSVTTLMSHMQTADVLTASPADMKALEVAIRRKIDRERKRRQTERRKQQILQDRSAHERSKV